MQPTIDTERLPAASRGPRAALWALAAGAAPPASAQGLWGTGNPFLDGLFVVLGLGVIWCLFYFFLYPRLLPHYAESGSRAIFWPLWGLYFFVWLFLCSYLFFDWGFEYLWVRWAAVVLVALCSIFFVLASFVRR